MCLRGLVLGLLMVFAAIGAAAQEVWVQIEAQPTLREAEERARAYAGVFPNVNGFAMETGWYAIVLGPFARPEADRQLRLLKGERLIPADSFIAFPGQFGARFWPVGAAAIREPAPSPVPTPDPAPSPVPDPAPAAAPAAPDAAGEPAAPLLAEESPAEARRSEALLSREERMQLQEALQWDGHYDGAIDGAFGAGTRRSMAAWQAERGYMPTGILTSAQRREILDHLAREQAALGLGAVTDAQAGIEAVLPLALVEFDRYEPPFVHYRPRDGSGFRVLLISLSGGQATLAGLYNLMQSLEIVPLSGERRLGREDFLLTGRDDRIASHTEAVLADGMIKGFTLVWPVAAEERAGRILAAMRAGFRPFGDQALEDGLGAAAVTDRAALVAGLAVRRPERSRTGFYASGDGLVLTTAEAVDGCGRITIDGTRPATIALEDSARGIAALRPEGALAPRASARLAPAPARIGTEIAVAGFPYEDALEEAVLSFGTLADSRGLDGEAELIRLSLAARPGDAGAPVLDSAGQVLGMLLPRDRGAARQLPDDVALALGAGAIADLLAGSGLTAARPVPAAATRPESEPVLAPQDLARLGRDLSVLVSCWK